MQLKNPTAPGFHSAPAGDWDGARAYPRPGMARRSIQSSAFRLTLPCCDGCWLRMAAGRQHPHRPASTRLVGKAHQQAEGGSRRAGIRMGQHEIAEGPNAIVHDGMIFLIYSGSLVGIDYTTPGLLPRPDRSSFYPPTPAYGRSSIIRCRSWGCTRWSHRATACGLMTRTAPTA